MLKKTSFQIELHNNKCVDLPRKLGELWVVERKLLEVEEGNFEDFLWSPRLSWGQRSCTWLEFTMWSEVSYGDADCQKKKRGIISPVARSTLKLQGRWNRIIALVDWRTPGMIFSCLNWASLRFERIGAVETEGEYHGENKKWISLFFGFQYCRRTTVLGFFRYARPDPSVWLL